MGIMSKSTNKTNCVYAEVVNMRKQFASPDKAQEVGNRDYRANRDTHYYMSKLTPEQFGEVKPFLETSVSYHAVVRDGKVAFAVDKENAPAFHKYAYIKDFSSPTHPLTNISTETTDGVPYFWCTAHNNIDIEPMSFTRTSMLMTFNVRKQGGVFGYGLYV